jgi:hypothetical protein
MPELITNLHMHTIYSDGSETHAGVAEAALEAGLDVIIFTDHNVLVQGLEGYLQKGERRVLMLIGEEVHDPVRDPQKNHLLVIGVVKEMAKFAPRPQNLIDQVQKAGGLSFIAHPYDPELKAFGEDDISWVDWDVRGFTGIELWNGLSELKTVVKGKLDGIFYALFPRYLAQGPLPATLKKWDELMLKGQRVVAVGGADAHALHKHLGPLRRTIFPYSYHFHSINTHLLVKNDLTGDISEDREMVYDALRKGHAFIGYDLPHPTRGFRFTAQGRESTVSMGDEIRLGNGVTLQIRLPAMAECRLVCNGEVVRNWRDQQICAHTATKPGVYRVECYVEYLGRRRGWIFSNPIYVRG